jgi:NADP-reducing hydrogenase subunit HndC
MTNRNIKYAPISLQTKEVVSAHGYHAQAVLEILVELEREHGSLTRKILSDVAYLLDLPTSKVFGIATFYSMLEVNENAYPTQDRIIRICDGPVCWLCKGSVQNIDDLVRDEAPDWKIERTSCLGLCDSAPAALLGNKQIGGFSTAKLGKVLSGENELNKDFGQERPGELRVMLAQAGKLNPDSLKSALSSGAYQGLLAAMKLTPAEVINEVEKSNLSGRGGAGFPVGRKWFFTASSIQEPKYVVCNADESEPLIFKDRVLIDTNPHQILEGMAIAAYAVGASSGYIYIRGEYYHQAERLLKAIEQAEKAGWLGNNIFSTDFSFKIHIHRGAGAYICGEETALLESLEGKRGEPRIRPPYPPTEGYLKLPTIVNNVESFASVPHIFRKGADWFKNLSNNASGGTKLYMLLGHINRPGIFEAPFGLTLRQIIEGYGEGMQPGSKFKFALCGGAAGTFADKSMMDIPVDYASVNFGISLGAGAFLVCDERVSAVALLRELMHFFSVESCGKCTPCREGTNLAYQILIRLSNSIGKPGDMDELLSLAKVMQTASFCGLGQSVYLPIKSAMRHFEEEFKAGIRS